MITVVIPTLNAEAGLADTLIALVPAAVAGLVREVIIVDAGSQDATKRIASEMGATVLAATPSRGGQLDLGARSARMPWLLFLHADTVLEPGWEREAADFMQRVDGQPHAPMAASFCYKLDDTGLAPRWLEAMVRLRCWLFALPFGDQGLLMPRRLYQDLGGYAPLPIMEDVDIVRRLGRRRLAMLRSCALTSAHRYRADGYLRRVVRNQICLALHGLGVPAERIEEVYGRRKEPGSHRRQIKST